VPTQNSGKNKTPDRAVGGENSELAKNADRAKAQKDGEKW